jgi:carbamoyltransferase
MVFKTHLAQLGYTEESLRQLLGIVDIPLLRVHHLPSYLERCKEDNSYRALLTCLWLLTLNVPRSQAEEVLGEEVVEDFLERKFLMATSGGRVKALADLYPCLGLTVLTDPVFATDFHPQHVYQLGTDSYVLARVTPRRAGQSALDLCTGSGVHALLAARHHQQVVGVDLNPRALEFARFNAHLNGRSEQTQFLQGDLYEPVRGRKFDLITANPPFVPTPDTSLSLHRGLGERGEEVSQRIVEGLAEHLAQGGTLSMVLDYPIFDDSTYLERLNRWIRGGTQATPVPGWGVAVINFLNESCEDYIRNHVDAGLASDFFSKAHEYVLSYQRLGIQAIGFANVFVRRLPHHHPGYSVIRQMPLPVGEMAETIEQWLDTLGKIYDSDWSGEEPAKISSRVKERWYSHSRDRVLFEFAEPAWSDPLMGDYWAVELLSRLDGSASLSEIARAYQAEHGPHPDCLWQFRRCLHWMLENLLVEPAC